MIFLSDGECSISDQTIRDVCRSAIEHGCATFPLLPLIADNLARKPLSFHAVSFGEDESASTLRRMAELALEVQNEAPRDPLLPETANIPSSFATALDSVSTSLLSQM